MNSPITPSTQANDPPKEKLPHKWVDLLRLVGIILFLPAFGVGVFFLTRFLAPNGWQPPQNDQRQEGVKALRNQLDAIETAKAEKKDQEQQALLRQVRRVTDDTSAQKALFDCYLKGGEAAQIGMMEAQFANVPEGVQPPAILEKLKNRKKLSESSEALIAEIKRVAAQYPKGFRAANEGYMDAIMPNRIRR